MFAQETEIQYKDDLLRFFSVRICKKRHSADLQDIAFKWGWCWSTANNKVSHEDKQFILFYRFKPTSDGVHRRRLRHSDNRNNKHIRNCAKQGIPVFRSDRDWASIINQIEVGFVPPNQLPIFSAEELKAIELRVAFKEGKPVGLANDKGERIDKTDLRKFVKDKHILYNKVLKRIELTEVFEF